jgi:hypothetical protein
MKQMKWPRPPMILGFVLGDIIERYLFISVERYGLEWLKRPVVAVVLIMAIIGLMRPLLQDVRAHGGVKNMLTDFGKPHFHWRSLFGVFYFCMIGVMVYQASTWNFDARIVPLIVGITALSACAISVLAETFRRRKSLAEAPAEQAEAGAAESAPKGNAANMRIHMDLESDTAHVPPKLIVLRAFIFFGWLVAFMASMATIGLIPTVPLFVVAFMRLENNGEPWKLVIPQAVFMTVFIYVVFDQLLTIPWPQTLFGTWFPVLKDLIPSM